MSTLAPYLNGRSHDKAPSQPILNQVEVVLGAQWGDEGKGKLVDILSANADIVVRCAGGDNAGHTVVAKVKTDSGEKQATLFFHLLPSGLAHNHTTGFIGHGVVMHLPSFFSEVDGLALAGLSCENRLFVSDRAHLVFDIHQIVDGIKEGELGSDLIGTTRRGIGPTYSDKASRCGLRVHHLYSSEFEPMFRRMVETHFARHGRFDYDVEAELVRYKTLAARLKPWVVDGVEYIHSALSGGQRVLVEGANAALLDIDIGSYPFVTSSNTTIGAVCTGLAIPPSRIGRTHGVVRLYTIRVGSGPFPTELENAIGDHLQEVGHEWGVTTGRKRRCGWLDLEILKFSHRINNYTSLTLTKLDVLDNLPEIKIGVGYKLNGKLLKHFPSDLEVLGRVDVVYKTFEGWMTPTTHIRKWSELPAAALKMLDFIETELGCPISSVGVGPDREATVWREAL